MAYTLDDKTCELLLKHAKRYDTTEFSFGLVVETIGYTGNRFKEFIPIIKITEEDLKVDIEEIKSEEEDKNTLDMWEYFKEI